MPLDICRDFDFVIDSGALLACISCFQNHTQSVGSDCSIVPVDFGNSGAYLDANAASCYLTGCDFKRSSKKPTKNFGEVNTCGR